MNNIIKLLTEAPDVAIQLVEEAKMVSPADLYRGCIFTPTQARKMEMKCPGSMEHATIKNFAFVIVTNEGEN